MNSSHQKTISYVNIPIVIEGGGKRITEHRELTKILFHIDWISMFYVEESITEILEMYFSKRNDIHLHLLLSQLDY